VNLIEYKCYEKFELKNEMYYEDMISKVILI